MRLAAHILVRCFASAALASVVAASAAGDKLEPVRSVLRRPWTDDDRTQSEVIQSLASVKNSVPILFRLYTGELSLGVTRESSSQTTWWCAPYQFNELYLGALAISPPDKVVGYLKQRTSAELPFESRISIVRVLGALSDLEGTDLLIDLSLQFTDLHLRSRTVTEPLEQAFATVFQADQESFEIVEERLSELSLELRDLICSAALTVPCPRSVAVLKRLIERDKQAGTELLGVIGQMHETRPWLFRNEATDALRPYLFSKDWQLRRTAAVSLAKLRDIETFSSIVLLLDDEHAAVRKSAEWSLQEMVGLSKQMTTAEWLNWYDSRLAWWGENQERLSADLQSGNAKLVMAAVRDLTQTSLVRDLAAQALADSLDDSNPGLLATVCRALEQLDCRGVVPSLVELLNSQDEEIRTTVNRTLTKLTGIESGPNYEDWLLYIQS